MLQKVTRYSSTTHHVEAAPCQAAPPPTAIPAPDQPGPGAIGFEVRFRNAADGSDITDPARIAELIGTEPFMRCLRGARVAVRIEEDQGEPYAWAASLPPQCRSEAVDYDDANAVAVVRIGTAPPTPPTDPPATPETRIETPTVPAPTRQPRAGPAQSAAPCTPDPRAAAIDWPASGLPRCARSLDYLRCGMQELAAEVQALEGRFTPVRVRTAVVDADPRRLCAQGATPSADLAALADLVRQLDAGREAVEKARACFGSVDDWTGNLFVCATTACDTPVDRAVRDFILDHEPRIEAELAQMTAALDGMGRAARTLRRQARAYDRFCPAGGPGEAR